MTINIRTDCDGKTLNIGDSVYIRQSALKAERNFIADGDRNFYYVGQAAGGLLLGRPGMDSDFCALENDVRYNPSLPRLAGVSCDGDALEVGDPVYVRKSSLSIIPHLTHENRDFIYLGTTMSMGVLVTVVGGTDGTTFAFPQDTIRKMPVPEPVAPTYYDADGHEFQIGSEVRVRLSALAYFQPSVKADRNFLVKDVAGDDGHYTIQLERASDGLRQWATSSDIRVGFDKSQIPAPVLGQDADGNDLHEGDVVRVRVSTVKASAKGLGNFYIEAYMGNRTFKMRTETQNHSIWGLMHLIERVGDGSGGPTQWVFASMLRLGAE